MNLGVDLSSYIEEVAHGAKWYLGEREVNPFEAFKENGIKYVRLRVWVDPYDEEGKPYLGGSVDTKKLLELALLAKEYGYECVVDFHYSDFWCDPAKQRVPKSWANLDFEGLKRVLREYTVQILTLLKERDIKVHAIQIGNEITNGLLWPFAHLEGEVPNRTGYEKVAAFLKEGIAGAKEVYPECQIILHLENSGNRPVLDEWYGHAKEEGLDYDVIGLSYYPYWHGERDNFISNCLYLKDKYQKAIWIMETAYGFTLEDYEKDSDGSQLVVGPKTVSNLCAPYPLTEEGQKNFVLDLLAAAKKAGIGEIYYWEPAYVPVKGAGWASESAQAYMATGVSKDPRNEWANQNLFDYGGKALPAFYAFKNDGKEIL